MSRIEKDSESVVRSMLNDWGTDGIRVGYERHLHPEVTVENSGFAIRRGKDVVLEMFDRYYATFKRSHAIVTILNLLASGDTVLVEREEVNQNRETGDSYTGRIMSTFVVKDGKIWRMAEYYDPSPYKFGDALPYGDYNAVRT